MSHFSVLVVTDQRPTVALLADALQPWHEYESTGVKDRYVVFVDEHDAVVKKHSESGETDLSLEEYAASEGYERLDQRFGRWTNPNSKWDWWMLGGRYSGRLIPVRDADAQRGEPSWTNKDETILGFDSCRVGDLDLGAMRREAARLRMRSIEEVARLAGVSVEAARDAVKVDKKIKAAWESLDEPRPRGEEYGKWAKSLGPDEAASHEICSRAVFLPDIPDDLTLSEWAESAPPLSAWAAVVDGQWTEKGEMGWFGISSGDKPDWEEQFSAMLRGLSADKYISVVDCHI